MAPKGAFQGAVSREDSDEELGEEDLPWEWIYSEPEGDSAKIANGDDAAPVTLNSPILPRKRGRPKKSEGKQQGASVKKRTIQGARLGNFECSIGDCVLLKAEGTSEAWVGLICDFRDAPDEEAEREEGTAQPLIKCANFMWFSSPKEIRNKDKKRGDYLPNELYITPTWDLNSLESINGKATIIGLEEYQQRYGSETSKKKTGREKWDGKTFLCRRGCNTRTASYTDEFGWSDLYSGTAEDILDLIEKVKTETRATRKRRPPMTETQQDFVPLPDTQDGEGPAPSTPRKKRKASVPATTTTTLEPTGSVPQTPKSGAKPTRSPRKYLPATPSSARRILVKRPLEFTPLGTRRLSPASAGCWSPFQQARRVLHASAVPAALPCREAEFEAVYTQLEAAIGAGSGLCIYISGIPGTGKTATVREVVAQLQGAVQADELDDFIFVEINGMKVPDPHQSYSLLWEALKGERVSATAALGLLEREFAHPSPRRVPCVVLMDELDQLVTANQSVMYNFFNWPQLRHSRLIVLAVANTMDLPERTLSNKIGSRLGLSRITFAGYTHEQLMRIIEARLAGLAPGLVEQDAIQFASRKVAAVSGDARRALDICRRAVEIAEAEAAAAVEQSRDENSLPPTPSKTPARQQQQQQHHQQQQKSKKGTVTIATIKAAINEATSNPLQRYLRTLPIALKVFLAAVLARVRRTGVADTTLGLVMDEAKRLVKTSDSVELKVHLLTRGGGRAAGALGVAGDGSETRARKAVVASRLDGGGMLPRVAGMGAAAVDLAKVGIITLETRRGERTARCRLAIGEDEVRLALKDDQEVRGMGFGA